MFYANFVLAKKGPLAKVWLAAHWEKKLSKAQVFETDLKSTVESIISPQVKIALRTSSHLLLGVVRIYSRKTKYLLADCTEALIKIKMSFRPEAVDLPLDNQKATVASITLPEFQEWDALVDNIGKFDYTKNKNQCRIEDITMKEDVLNPRFLSDDNFFGDTPFGETSREVMRDEVSIDQSMQLQADLSKISDVTMKDKHDVTNQSLKDLDAMMLEDGGFGAGEGLDFMEDFNIDGQITGLEDPQLTGLEDAQITGLEDLDKDLEPLEKTALGEEDGDKTLVNGEEQVLEEKADVVVEEPEVAPMDQTVPPDHTVPDITELGTAELPTAIETTMFTRASENLALDPIEETIKGKGKKKNRKRKLVVDNEKIIDSVTFKKQLQNYEDLVKKATVAPPTKIRMRLYDSSVKSLYSHPCSHKYPRAIAQWYSDNQTVTVPDDFVLQSSQEDELELEQIPQEQQHEVADIEVARDAQEHNPDEQQLVLVNGELEEVEKTRDNESEFPALPEEEQFVGVMDPLEEQPLNEDEVNFAPPFVEEPQEVPAEVEKTLNTTSELESEFESSAMESGPSKKRWTKRSQQTLNAIEKTTNKTGLATVNFNTEILGRKCSRKQAALKFYTLLMLNKEKAIIIKQDEVFGDIHLEKGVNFRKCLAH